MRGLNTQNDNWKAKCIQISGFWHLTPYSRAHTVTLRTCLFVCLCWGLTSHSTIFQSCRDGATASWVINQYFRGVKCLAQGHNTAAVGIEPPTSRSGVRHSTNYAPVKIRKSKYNLQCLTLKLIAKVFYAIPQTKAVSMTRWKFLVQQVWIII